MNMCELEPSVAKRHKIEPRPNYDQIAVRGISFYF